MQEEAFEDLRVKLNLETGRMPWTELQRHFARGIVVSVDGKLDLIEVAVAMAEDDAAKMATWTESGAIVRATEEQAIDWNERNAEFWVVVIAPWVVVQEITATA